MERVEAAGDHAAMESSFALLHKNVEVIAYGAAEAALTLRAARAHLGGFGHGAVYQCSGTERLNQRPLSCRRVVSSPS